jgi:hypothetical protein
MRGTFVASIAALGLIATASAARAVPVVIHDSVTTAPAGIIEVRGGCGPGWHPVGWQDRWGRWHRRCVPNYRRW